MNTGIYAIEHVASGKIYCGSAVNFRDRWNAHRSKLRRGRHHSRPLQNAWSKYGEAAFAFKKLLVCSKENLLMYEQLCIKGYRATEGSHGYNVCSFARSALGLKRAATSRKATRDACPHAKLSMDRAREMRWLYSEGVGLGDLAELFGVSKASTHKAVTGLSWREDLEAPVTPIRLQRPAMSDAQKEKLRATQLGRVWPTHVVEKRAAACRGRSPSAATREKIRAALKGRPVNPEWREKNLRRVAKLNQDQVSEIRYRLKQGQKQTEIAALYSVNKSAVSRIALGKTWREI